jgi:hypothetical protein
MCYSQVLKVTVATCQFARKVTQFVTTSKAQNHCTAFYVLKKNVTIAIPLKIDQLLAL